MNENTFRARLITEFTHAWPYGFIWPTGSRFKAGFPDLCWRVRKGRETSFAELKATEDRVFKPAVSYLRPLQAQVVEQMARAYVPVRIFVVRKPNRDVLVGTPFAILTQTTRLEWLDRAFSWNDFIREWVNVIAL